MRGLVGLSAMLVVFACSGPAPSPAAVVPTSQSAQPAAGGCGGTQAQRGPVPAWVDAAAGHNVPNGLPYVTASPDVAAGFLFGYPLRAGHPQDRSNKVLWVVRTPRQGSNLQIDAHPLGAQQPVVHESRPAGSGPGEIYPDGIDVPTPGCWQLTLVWATGRAEVNLAYE